MELILTTEQKNYLNERGPLKASALQRVYKKSVEDQQSMLKQAEQMRSRQGKKK